jgi:hypothetical protein
MRKLTAVLAASVVLAFSGIAIADLSVKDGAGVTRTIKNFVCETTKLCNATVLIKSDGTEIGISTAEVFVGGRGTAGSAAGGVLTVQGAASGTAIPVSGTVTATPTGTQAVSIASAQVASGAYASGSVSAGAYAAGALAAGAFATGAGVDGWDVTQGAKADSVCGTATGTCSVVALLKYLNNSVNASIPAGTNLIGDVNLRQGGTALSATNGIFSNCLLGNAACATGTGAQGATSQRVAVATDTATVAGTAPAAAGLGAAGSAAPSGAQYNGVLDAVGGTNMIGLAGDPCQTSVKTTLPITLATAAVKVIAVGVSAKKIYVCQIHLTNNAADSVAVFEATTATTCATSAVAVVGGGTSVATAATGYNFAANGGISLGMGSNQVLQTSVNANDLCIAQSAATQLSGSITYVTR